jgi:hypothetical protein
MKHTMSRNMFYKLVNNGEVKFRQHIVSADFRSPYENGWDIKQMGISRPSIEKVLMICPEYDSRDVQAFYGGYDNAAL